LRKPLFFFIFSIFLTHIAQAQPKYDACYMPNTTFQGGEELVYKIYYNWNFVWLAAGEVVCRVKEDSKQYHINAQGKTYPSYEFLYR
jgi:Protein of unknown function (DUF3108)